MQYLIVIMNEQQRMWIRLHEEYPFEMHYEDQIAEKSIIEYTTNHYRGEFEHLWKKFPDDSIIRKKENKKWHFLFIKAEAKKEASTKIKSMMSST